MPALKIKYDYSIYLRDLASSYFLKSSYNSDLFLDIDFSDDPHNKEILAELYALLDNNIKKDERFSALFSVLDIKDSPFKSSLATLVSIFTSDLGDERTIAALELLLGQEFKSLEHVFDFLAEDDLFDGSFKYNLLYAYYNRESLLKEIDQYLKGIYALESDINNLCQPIIDDLKSLLADDYVKEVFEHYNLKLLADFDFVLSLDFVELNSISMLAVDNRIYVNWGVMGRKNFAKEKTLDTLEKEFLETIKYLSDPTKLNIIKFCLAEDRYGAEIAKELELTSATISHHMKDLTENNLITFTLDKKRIYYRANKELILKRIKNIETILQ